MERFKDFVYENTDVLLGILVVLLIGIVINSTFSVFDGGILSVLERSRTNGTEEWQEWSQESGNEDPVDNTSENRDDQENGDEEEENGSTGEDSVTITIPENSLPQKFAEILHENDLVDSEQDFITRLVELEMDRFLRAGSYEIPKDADLDEIISILTRRTL